MRFVDITVTKPHVTEAIMKYLHLERATGNSVATGILGLFAKHVTDNHLPLDVENMRGQSFDGPSAMAGEQRGAQACIKEKNLLAFYTHCRSHVLSLAIAKSCSVQALHQMIDVINETYLFFSLSPKRQRFLELVLSVCAPESRVHKLKGICKTRWTERLDCPETFRSLYEYIFTCMDAMVEPREYPQIVRDECDWWGWDTSTKTKVEGLKQSLRNGRNIIVLVVLVNGLDALKGLRTKLQKRDTDVTAAYRHIDSSINEVRSMRENFDSVWDEWYTEAEEIVADVGGVIDLPRMSKHQRNCPNTPANSAR